mgnify:CR=1 FL=1
MSILLNKDTTFIVQGITGREAVNLTKECLDYGSKVVGGVTPGRKGREVHGVPVFDTVGQAVENHGGPIDGSIVTVPPGFTKDAVIEAIANGVPAFRHPKSKNAANTLLALGLIATTMFAAITLLAITASWRRPASARPNTSSATPSPYISAVSKKFTRISSAACTVAA